MVLLAWLLVTAPIYLTIGYVVYKWLRTAEKKEQIVVQEKATAVVPVAVTAVSNEKKQDVQVPTDDELLVVISAAVNIYMRSHQLKTK